MSGYFSFSFFPNFPPKNIEIRTRWRYSIDGALLGRFLIVVVFVESDSRKCKKSLYLQKKLNYLAFAFMYNSSCVRRKGGYSTHHCIMEKPKNIQYKEDT